MGGVGNRRVPVALDNRPIVEVVTGAVTGVIAAAISAVFVALVRRLTGRMVGQVVALPVRDDSISGPGAIAIIAVIKVEAGLAPDTVEGATGVAQRSYRRLMGLVGPWGGCGGHLVPRRPEMSPTGRA